MTPELLMFYAIHEFHMSREEALAEPWAELIDLISYLGAFNGTVKIINSTRRRVSILDRSIK